MFDASIRKIWLLLWLVKMNARGVCSSYIYIYIYIHRKCPWHSYHRSYTNTFTLYKRIEIFIIKATRLCIFELIFLFIKSILFLFYIYFYYNQRPAKLTSITAKNTKDCNKTFSRSLQSLVYLAFKLVSPTELTSFIFYFYLLHLNTSNQPLGNLFHFITTVSIFGG